MARKTQDQANEGNSSEIILFEVAANNFRADISLATPAMLVEPAIPADAPVIGLTIVVKLPMAADAGDAPAHVAPTKGAAPDVVGLTPGVASSVAPRGIPVCPTGALGTPSGHVMPKAGSGETLVHAWAWAEPQPSRAAAVTTAKRLIIGSTFLSRKRVGERNLVSRLRPTSVRIAATCRILPFSASERAGKASQHACTRRAH
jgi:hypothetical protein